MGTGYRGTFVISWAQTEVGGLAAVSPDRLSVGESWRWSGEALRVDGPREILRLDQALGEPELRRRAAKVVHKLVGAAMRDVPNRKAGDVAADDPMLDRGFEVTDGRESFVGTVIEVPPPGQPLLMFLNSVPPADADLWVVRTSLEACHVNRHVDQPTGVICFTPGTRIRTCDGEKRVEDLDEGDRVQTRDDGVQEILWIGQRKITGARLHAIPELRPVRLRVGALGMDQPDGDLVVSPQHRMLIKGVRARALFNTDEVLVAAEDLIDDRRVHVDHSLREVVYYHLLLERHQVVWANGVETESFHPANSALDTIEGDQRQRLLSMFPALDYDPLSYGDYARRTLTRYEAAILRSEVA